MAHAFDLTKFGWKDGAFDTLLYYGVDPDRPIAVPLLTHPDGTRQPVGYVLGEPQEGEKQSAYLLMGGQNGLLEAALDYAGAKGSR